MLFVDFLELHFMQCLVDSFLGIACRDLNGADIANLESRCNLIFDVGFKAADHKTFVFKVVYRVVALVGQHGGIEHVDKACKALGLAVVRRSRKHDERVRSR